jgi:hypothetical protein
VFGPRGFFNGVRMVRFLGERSVDRERVLLKDSRVAMTLGMRDDKSEMIKREERV